jgi:hypothetical protein
MIKFLQYRKSAQYHLLRRVNINFVYLKYSHYILLYNTLLNSDRLIGCLSSRDIE